MKHVATKYNLERYVKFNTKVQSATWDEEAGVWVLKLVGPDGVEFEDRCEILANGSGVLKLVLPLYRVSVMLNISQFLEIPKYPRDQPVRGQAYAQCGLGQFIRP